MPSPPKSGFARVAAMTALIVAGEAVFLLPFVVPRVFRPTLLDVFGITNLELGSAFSLYGVVAMLSYLLGGPLADHFSARKLMTAALLATSLGGAVSATIPPARVLMLVYAFWGATTILLFWAALIRATREWGGAGEQGWAYGLLDGGRGLFAALVASASVAILAGLLPADVDAATFEQKSDALQRIIWIYSGLTAAAGALVWAAVPDAEVAGRSRRLTLESARSVLRFRSVRLQALIVICGYVGYKSTDLFSLYARDVYGYDEVAAAQVGALAFWLRPAAAVVAGLLGDRFESSKVIACSFAVLILGCCVIASGVAAPGPGWILAANVAAASVCVYAIRGLYYALFGEANLPLAWTGAATGLVSTIGYTPDVFMGPLSGYLLDGWPGETGHQLVFAIVAGFAAVGLAASLRFRREAAERI